MRLGIIAEGNADVAVIKAVLKALKGIDGSDVVQLRPREQYDETDLNELSFSNWNLVLQSCLSLIHILVRGRFSSKPKAWT